MNILFIVEELDRPEAHLISGIVHLGHHVILMMPAKKNTPPILEGAVERFPVRLDGRIDREGIRSIRHTVQDCDIDIVHCLRNNRPVSNALMAVRGLSVKIVCYRGTVGNISRWNPGDWMTYLSHRLDRIICVSNGVKRSLAEAGTKPSKLVTVYKGHDPAWYQSVSRPDLAELGIPADAFVVGCAANMRRLKGVDLLIKSLGHLTAVRPVHLLLIGEVRDPLIEDLTSIPRFRSLVHLAGYREDATALSGACDLCAMPSRRREGLPRAVIEAMSQSIPAIVTDVGGMPELVVHETSGLVVPPGNAVALGRAISRMVNEPTLRNACAVEAKKRIETEFNITHTIERTEGIYRAITSESSHNRT